MLDLKGIIPALISPMDKEGKLDTGPIPSVLKFCIERGIRGVFVGGSTGEGFCLTTEERKHLTEVVVQEVSARVPVVVHVGSLNFREVLDLSEHAFTAGADAISSVVPFYYKYSLDEVRNYYRAIAEASTLPTIIYAFSQVATSTYPSAEFVDAMLSFDGIYGIKFTDLDLARMQSMKQLAKGKFHIYGGVDVMALPMFCMGADGLIGSNYGALPEPWVAIYNTFQSGDLRKALKMQDRIGYYVRSFKHLWGAQRAKILLKVRGIDVGDAWLPKGSSTAEDFALCRKLWDELVTDPVFEGHIRQ